MKTQVLPITPESVALAAKLLQQGELVALPTETVYGIAADARNGEAVKKIFEAKGRPQDNPLIVHICGMEMLQGIVSEVPERAKKLAAAFWPGPLTMVMPRGPEVSDVTCAGLDTVGVRMPSHPVVQQVIRESGVAFAAPSANLSGKPSPTNAPDTLADMDGRLPLILDGGECTVGVESTVITVVTEIPRVLRPGGVSVEQLRRVLGRVDVDRAVLEKPAENAKVASPGMKYKHYAPKADVYMVDASAEDYAAFLHTHPEAAALCFNEDVPYLKNRCVPYGSAADSLSQAHGLFTSLHHLDEIGAKTVYARMPRKSGVGLAVYNRLIRACAFRIVTPNEQLVIGLTGQTGAGKSTVAKQLKARGCVIIDCDAVTHDPSLYAGTCLTELQNAFGRAIIKEDGTLDRRRLANLAFASEEGKAKLNAITHPVILARLKKEIAAYKDAKVIVLDAPTLFEAGADRLCRRVVSVLADETVRLGRICRRDGLTEQEALTRMHAQQSDDFYIDRSDYTLDNTVAVSADNMDNMLAVLGCAHPGESD